MRKDAHLLLPLPGNSKGGALMVTYSHSLEEKPTLNVGGQGQKARAFILVDFLDQPTLMPTQPWHWESVAFLVVEAT